MSHIHNVRNIGISAHIDSGKTTLTERILYYTGKIHRMSEVHDKGAGAGATMDSMDLEREKGITIQSAATYCEWNKHDINIIDTPGHVDFTIEVERSLRVLDGAVLILCAVGGVQSQSMTVDRQMKRYNVPVIAFINKMDRVGSNPVRVRDQLRDKLRHNAVLLQVPIGSEAAFRGVVDLVTLKAYYFDGDQGENVREDEIPAEIMDEVESYREEMLEALGDVDDDIAEAYLAGEEIDAQQLKDVVRRATLSRELTPVFVGSAYKNKGVQKLLDAVVDYLPHPAQVDNTAIDPDNNEAEVQLSTDPEEPFVGLAFKLEDGRFGQLTYLRIYQGTLSKGDYLINTSANGKKVKLPRLVRLHADQMEDVASASAGDIVALFGLDCASGDTFTDGRVGFQLSAMHVPDPVIELAIAPTERGTEANFSKALNRFTKEDPTFQVRRDPESGETVIAGMGELHLDIYIERIRREYKCSVEVGRPKVAYREAITRRAEFNYTHKKQTGGRGQFARVMGYLEPLSQADIDALNAKAAEAAGGAESDAPAPDFHFVNEIKGGAIPREYIPACEAGFRQGTEEGALIGFPVVGVKVCVNDGLHHPVDSSEMAFKTASWTAFRDTYAKAAPTILEPVMLVEITAPEEFQGTVIGQLNQRRGRVLLPENSDGWFTVSALVPLAEMFGYASELRSGTQGKGEFTMEFSKYEEVPAQIRENLLKESREKLAS